MSSRLKSVFFFLAVMTATGSAWGQDLTYYFRTGRFTPHSPVASRTGQESFLIYDSLGLMVHLSEGGQVVTIAVFQPRTARPTVAYQRELIVPGVSAYGIVLGMSKRQVNASPIISSAVKRTEDARYGLYELQDGRKVMVCYANDKTTQVEVWGYFTTKEGITERNLADQIKQVYGVPDRWYNYRRGDFSKRLSLTVLAMPLFGLLTGLAIRVARRWLSASAAALAVSISLGALGMAAGFAVSGLSFSATGFVDDMPRMIWLAIARGCLAGGSAVAVMELLCPRLNGPARSAIVIMAMVFVALNASILIDGLTGVRLSVMYFTGPFVAALFFASGEGRKSTSTA